MAWVLRLVKIDAEGEGQATDVMEIERPGELADIADLGLTLDETKRLLRASNSRSSRHRSGITPFGGRRVPAAAAFAR